MVNRVWVLTVRKLRVGVGDGAGAMAAARYLLGVGDSPGAFAAGAGGEVSPSAMWLGSQEALSRLGLVRGGEVSGDGLASVLQGRHAADGSQVRRPGSVVAVRGGERLLDEEGLPYRELVVNSFDVTFSVPKSVSVLWSQADAVLRAEIERAVLAGADAAVGHVVGTRLVIGGKEAGSGFAGAAALHVVARTARGEVVPAPQLHVHVELVGVTDAGGRLRTPHAAALYKNSAMREGGAVGRAVLARELVGLGFGVRMGTGRGERYFEVDGVPAGLCERLSGRTRDVKAWVQRRESEVGGRLSGRAAARGAVATRQRKEELSAVVVQESWDRNAQEFGFGREAIARLRGAGRDSERPERAGGREAAGGEREPGRDVEALRAELSAAVLGRLWQEGPVVSLGAVRSMAFELAPVGLSLGEVSGVLAGLEANGELVAVDGWRVTSREIRSLERYVARVAVDAAQRPGRGLSKTAVRSGVGAAEADLGGSRLDPEQRDAVEMLTGGGGWACLTGRAGTGKGPVLQAVAHAYREQGWRVIACALDGATTQRLGHQVGAQALTIAQLLHRVESGRLVVGERTLLLVDEASKVGLAHWGELARLVEGDGARLLAVGDVGQIGAIESPGMLDVMLQAKEVPTARLEEVRRHRDPADRSRPHPWLVDYQTELYAGDATKAIDRLRREGAIAMHDSREQAMVALVSRWEDRRSEHGIAAKDAVLIVYGSNDDVDQVNALAQQRRLAASEVWGEGVQAPDRHYRLFAGDVVMLRDGAYQPQPGIGVGRVENGTAGVIEYVDRLADRVVVAFDHPTGTVQRVDVDLARLRNGPPRGPQLRLAYAGHPFPMQGATFDYVGSLWGHWSQRKEETYSGDTRARLWLDVHADRQSLGTQGNDNDRYERLAERLKRPWHRLASITYDETPETEIAGPVREPVPPPVLPAHRDLHRTLLLAGPDPLERIQQLLGPTRTQPIHEHAVALTPEISLLDDDQLLAIAKEGHQAIDELDRDTVRQVLRLERDLALLATQIDQDRRHATQLQAAVDELPRTAHQQRHDLTQAAQTAHHNAQADQHALQRLDDQDQQLQANPNHPDTWTQAHTQILAQATAAQDQLKHRHPTTPQLAAEPAQGHDQAIDEAVKAPGEHEPQLR